MAELGLRIANDQNIATVWLLSSLGASHNSNVKKREIVKVSIPHACEVLASTQVTIPLRHTGQLLYGVTVCYERKTGFILSDVNTLRDALQRQWIGLKPLGKTSNASNASGKRNIVSNQVITETDNNFLQDDPNFDVMLQLKMNNGLDFLNNLGSNPLDVQNATAGGVTSANKNAIRQDDIWKEIEPGHAQYLTGVSRVPTVNRELGYNPNQEDDDDDLGPIDVELNFQLDDVLTDNESEVANLSTVNSDLGLNYDREVHPEIDLGMPILEEMETSNPQLELMKRRLGLDDEAEYDEMRNFDAPDANSNSRKRQKVSTDCYQRLKVDSSVSLLTDTLRHNHENYVEIMKDLHDKRSRKARNGTSNWKSLFSNEYQSPLVMNIYSEVFQAFSSINLQQGRRGRTMHSTNDGSRSSSILSLEHGRRMEFGDPSSGTDSHRFDINNLPEQVNEYPEDMDIAMDDPQFIELDIPPSSFGKHSTRNHTADSDNLENLRWNTQRRVAHRGETGSGSFVGNSDSISQNTISNTQQQMLIHDRQTEKFYQYISERASEVGKIAVEYSGFSKKFLFEDIIPSKLSQEEDEEVTPVTKRIACNAFMSLLQLATLGKIKIDLYDVNPEDQFETLNGDDIVVYC